MVEYPLMNVRQANQPMRLLVACGGESDVQVFLADLQRAGLPPTVAVIVLAVADLLPIPSAGEVTPLPAAAQRARERAARMLEAARQTAEAAAAQLRAAFPGWSVSAEAQADTPAWAVVKKSGDWRADLIVVGSHDRSALGRLLLGSASQTVLTHAPSSVRVARRPHATPDSPHRVLVGVDGSPGAVAAAAQAVSRTWRPLSEVRLVAALDETLASSLEQADDFDDEHSAASRLLERAAVPVRAAGYGVSMMVIEGHPAQVLVEQAESWKADCVFVGARGLRGIERILLGSVSTAVAARVPCSVEVIR